MSTAAVMNTEPESWDVSGAFLKGLAFSKVRETLLQQRVKTPDRAVVVIPPSNCWKHVPRAEPTRKKVFC